MGDPTRGKGAVMWWRIQRAGWHRGRMITKHALWTADCERGPSGRWYFRIGCSLRQCRPGTPGYFEWGGVTTTLKGGKRRVAEAIDTANTRWRRGGDDAAGQRMGR